MADKVVQVPGVGNVSFPDSMSDDQIGQAIQSHYVQNPAHAFKAAPSPLSLPWLKEKLYSALDSATQGLPAAGAMAGATIGAGVGAAGGSVVPGPGTAAGGAAGAIGGAGIGGMGGEAAKQLLRRWLGYESPQTSEEAAQEITKQGAIQGGLEAVSAGTGALAGPLQRNAETQYLRALAPTTKQNKVIAEKIAPQMMDRGISGSLPGIEKQAAANAAEIKPQLNAAYNATPASATKGSGWQILTDLQQLKNKYLVQGKVANPEAVNAINGVQDIVQQYGPDISPNSLRKLKSIFDDPVAQAGGYAGTDLTAKYGMKAKAAAANSIRDLMSQANPDVASLNKEISFWLDVQRVAGHSALRQTGQQGGLLRALGPLGAGAAAGAGFATQGTATSLSAGAMATAITALGVATRLPQWRTTSALFKNSLADAFAAGNVGRATALLGRLGVAVGEGTKASGKADQTASQ